MGFRGAPGSLSRLPPVLRVSEDLHDAGDAHDDPCKSVVVDPVRRVLRRVVVGVPEGRGIGDHDARVSLPPKGPLVGPADPGDPRRGG